LLFHNFFRVYGGQRRKNPKGLPINNKLLPLPLMVMIMAVDILHINPSKYGSRMAPLSYFHDCCSGCANENDTSSRMNGTERMEKCDHCIKELLEPAYMKGKPFIFDRRAGVIEEI
jgi:hypothetical protein